MSERTGRPADLGTLVLRRARARQRRRYRAVIGSLTAAVLVAGWLTLAWGTGAGEVVGHLGELLGLPGAERSFAIRLRLPRAALSILVGIAFALAGGLFQSVLRNALASPDILGVNAAASLAGAWAILVLGVSGALVSLAAFLGAVAVAALIVVLAWRDGLSGLRFVLIGVGMAFVANAGIGYLLTRTEVNDARSALVWMVGSIGTPAWSAVATLAVALMVLVPLAALAVSRLRALDLGDDTASGLGVRANRTRVLILVVAVALAAVATAFAGPIAFVAFVSAPIARRMLPESGSALAPAALIGALVVLLAGLVTDQLLASFNIPVGIVTGAVGAPYLLWLLATSGRTRG
ncbi:FecCD family ABC transporter permease [Ruania halotolerans]|uniref:FecCD family ABC transporter permease n=1 Tax=Ruania halotolerans TaxID=2897773 RepID=UPI001E36F2C7|nr:iron chelate uptake ABC transporter family permease subunit [Ruania halotolerans]UFU08223.1 iron chelate uptake ABC transporter family permease subunit [Ruania halotolerans]